MGAAGSGADGAEANSAQAAGAGAESSGAESAEADGAEAVQFQGTRDADGTRPAARLPLGGLTCTASEHAGTVETIGTRGLFGE